MAIKHGTALVLVSMFALAALIPMPAKGVVIRHDRGQMAAAALAREFPAACCISDFFSGVLIAPTWVLTVAHGAEHYESLFKESARVVKIGDEEFQVIGIAVPKERKPLDVTVRRSSMPEDEDPFNLHDIALLRLKRPVRHVQPAVLYEGNQEVGLVGVVVGCGTWLENPTEGVSHAVAQGAPQGVSYACTNRIDTHLEKAHLLGATFERPDEESVTDLECGFGIGDSGSPLFVQDDSGDWRVAGVMSQGHTATPDRIGQYGDQLRWTRVADYTDWIRTTIKTDNYTRFETARNNAGTTLEWPDSVAGRLGKEFVAAMQAPDDALLREFFRRNYSASALEAKSLDARVRDERAILQKFGGLHPIRISQSNEFKIRIVLSTERVGINVAYEFTFYDAEPHRIAEMSFGPDWGR